MASEPVSVESEGFRVSVTTEYQVVYSRPADQHFVFAYTVKIENLGETTVKLMRRHWLINDSVGESYEVEGEGVVGEQPVLEPNDEHIYTSGCGFKSYRGSMSGTYLMRRLVDEHEFKIRIPEFVMIVPEMFR